MKDLISVVIPIYNVSQYLRKCIDSVINQTYENLEIFLVDDGATDDSGSICDEYALKDNRIKVIHKENGGLSDARNVALDVITGKYVTCIDSDDYVGLDYISSMYDALISTGSDMAVCTFGYVDEQGNFINKPSNSKKVECLSQKKALYELLNTKKYSNSAWGKLYKSEHFSDVRYPKGEVFEDIPTTYKLFLKSQKIAYVDDVQYYYLYRATGLSKVAFKPSRMNAIYFCEQMVNDILKEHPDLENISKCRLFDAYYGVFENLNTPESEEYRDFVEKKLAVLSKQVLFIHTTVLRRKALAVKYLLSKVI